MPSGWRLSWDARFAGSSPFPSTMPPAPILRAGSARRCAPGWCCVRANGLRLFEKPEAIGAEKIATIDPADLACRSCRASRANAFVPLRFSPPIHSKSFSPPAPRPSPRESCSLTPTWSATSSPIETEIRKYLKYERLVHPIRFLNLLPLSHVFGQFLGIFLPPLLGGTVVFENTFNPTEVMATIRRERVSVLVAVPRMIESLKQKIERDLEDRRPAASESFAARYAAAKSQHFLRRWWTFRDSAPPVRMEVLGHHQRRRCPRSRDGRILASPGIRHGSGLRPHRNHFADQSEPSLPHQPRLHRQSAAGARNQAGRRRRNYGSRQRRCQRLLERPRTATRR